MLDHLKTFFTQEKLFRRENLLYVAKKATGLTPTPNNTSEIAVLLSVLGIATFLIVVFFGIFAFMAPQITLIVVVVVAILGIGGYSLYTLLKNKLEKIIDK